MTPRPLNPSPINEAMQASCMPRELELIQARIERNLILHPPATPIMAPLEVQEYASRLHPQEIDTVEICPAYPDYMVIGTYSLVRADEDRQYPSQVRKGMISIEPVEMSSKFQPLYLGEIRPALDKKQFSCAITDIHFHPMDTTLLGAAASDGSMYFFRFIKHADVIGRRVHFKLTSLGSIKIAEDDPHGAIPLVTQFVWFPNYLVTGSRHAFSDKLILAVAATTSDHEVKVVKTALENIRTLFDPRLANQPEVLNYDTVDLQPHTLEAWCVAHIKIPTLSGHENFAVFSGGDDSSLSCNLLEMEIDPGTHIVERITHSTHSANTSILARPPTHIWTDRKTHQAGVVAILPLPAIQLTTSTSTEPQTAIPLLTGSYDEHLRLYLLHPITLTRTLTLEHKLPGGGVWRLKRMDTYHTTSVHHLILVSLMHGGVRIIRLSHDHQWSIDVLATFTKGHDSMVYSCDFTQDTKERGAYTVVSTSFYDKRVCVWRFVDAVKAGMAERECT